jgi:DNA-binding NarL/FixJ family response regulator
MSIAVSIVEDDKKTREALSLLIKRSPNLRCAGTYPSGEAALREIGGNTPEVILVDINLPGMSGIELVAKLKRALPDLQILMVTTYEESDLIFDSLRAGASGYLLKRSLKGELEDAVEQVHSGGAPMSMQIARRVVDYFRKSNKVAAEVEGLSPRERDVLAALAKGLPYKQIADALGISLNTVRMHQRNIYEKLHVHCRTDAVMKFIGRG